MTVRKVLILIAAAALLGGWDWLRTADKNVVKGNAHVRAGAYDKALARYRGALRGGGDRFGIRFNMGVAHYRLAEGSAELWQRADFLRWAETDFRSAAQTSDRFLRCAALYNLGNVLFQLGDYAAAIEQYQRSLRCDLARQKARFNLEMAQRRLAAALETRGRSAAGTESRGPAPPEPDTGSGMAVQPAPQAASAAGSDGPARARGSERRSEIDRKLEALERLSREQKRQRLKREDSGASRGGVAPAKDW